MTTETIRTYEQLLVALDERPWDALYRFVIGFAVVPVFSRVSGRSSSGWELTLFLLATLFALRLVPAVVRKLVGFSAAAQEVWIDRRLKAKHYDSYQWQKLLWIGVGLSVSIAISGDVSTGRLAVAAICLVSGGAGLAVWRGRADAGAGRSRPGWQSAKQNLSPAPQHKP